MSRLISKTARLKGYLVLGRPTTKNNKGCFFLFLALARHYPTPFLSLQGNSNLYLTLPNQFLHLIFPFNKKGFGGGGCF